MTMQASTEAIKTPVPLFRNVTWAVFGLSVFERTSYFTLKFLLILVLADQMRLGDARAALVMGAAIMVNSLVYPLSGLLSDRVVGLRFTLMMGLCLITPGYLLLSFMIDFNPNGPSDVFKISSFLGTLAVTLCGIGIVRLAGFNMVRCTLPDGDHRNERLYALYYWVDTIAALLGTITAGTLAQKFGWTPVLGGLAAGMLACGIVIHFNRRQLYLPDETNIKTRRPALGIAITGSLITGAFVLLNFPTLAGLAILLMATGIAVFIYRNKHEFKSPKHREYLYAFSIVTICSVLFATVQEQQWSSLVLFADRVVDRTAFGVTLHASHFQAIGPIMLVLLTPVVAAMAGRNRLATSSGRLSALLKKITLAFLVISMCFGVLYASTFFTNADSKVHLLWLVAALMLAGPSELFIFPAAYNAVTENAPPKLASTMSGLHFTCYAAVGYASGLLASLAGRVSLDQGLAAVVLNYRDFLFLTILIGGGFMLFVLACAYVIKLPAIAKTLDNSSN
ncbi:MAG: MFS transporter [Pseudomonadota bacterium]